MGQQVPVYVAAQSAGIRKQGRIRMRRVTVWALWVLLATWSCSAVTVTVNPAIEHQTMDGFGAHGAMDVWWSNGPFYNDQFLSWILDDLGMTIFRNEFYPDETREAMGYRESHWQKQLPYLRAVKAAADSRGIDVKFMATLWSPPGGMKYNQVTKGTDVMWNRVSNGLGPYNNYLEPDKHPEKGGKPDMYPAFVDYCADAVERYRDDAGIELYAFSPANEPRFAQSFNSCVWEPEQYRDMIALLGPEFQRRGLTTKIVGAEDMAARCGEYAGRINVHAPAKPHLHIFAVHGYSNGVDPYLPNTASRRMAQIGTSMGIPVWMTETSGYHETWEDALKLGMTMAAAIKWGRVAGWVWWQLGGGTTLNEYDLMTKDTRGIRYYVSKNFYRYIRPGAVLVESASDDDAVLDIAFNDKQRRRFVMVLVNTGASSKTVAVSGGDVPSQLHGYRSSSGERCGDIGTVSSGAVSLPAGSITTLVADNYAPVGVADSHARAAEAVSVRLRGAQRRLFSIDGRVVATHGDARPHAAGVYCVQLRGTQGHTVGRHLVSRGADMPR
ncbi:MAG: hypothetical protein GF331_08925 [Chitinivibrionales bacterium]|nr:hypothetical protein [Chitinivibrionales bacterium]